MVICTIDFNIISSKTMYKQVLVLLLIVLGSASVRQVVKFTMSSYLFPDKSMYMQLDIITPRSPSTYAPILFMTGVQGLIPNQFYSLFMESIATEGYITISVAKLHIPSPAKATEALKNVIDWLNQNFQQVISQKVPGVTADFQNRFILMGHSAAGHATTQYLNQTCGNVKLHILIDPVDGADPLGIKNDFIITPGKMLPYAVPVLVISNELDSHPKMLNPPCAPLNLSNTRFYNAMSGPKWFLNVSKYGHIDFYNAQYRDLSTMICQTCKKNCDYAEYRQTLKDAITHFINAIFNKNKASMAIIENAKFKIPTQYTHNYMGYNPMNGGFCQRKNQENSQHLSLKIQSQ